MKVIATLYPVENQTLYERITISSWQSLLSQLDAAFGDPRVQAVGFDVCCEGCEHVSQTFHIELDRLRVALADT